MLSALSGYANRLWDEAFALNERNIATLLRGCGGTLVDCGCGDGVVTVNVAGAAFSRVVGLEIDPEVGAQAASLGVEVVPCDLNERMPLDGGTADALVANQIIEHLSDSDGFFSEAARVLKPGGRLVLSTENISSWHNVAAIALGWQPFSLTNISGRASGVGNPMALHRSEGGTPVAMQHLRLFTARALREMGGLHGLTAESVLGAGYFPFRGSLSNRLSALDSTHSMFIALEYRR